MFVIIDTPFECLHLAFSNLKVKLNPSTGTYVLLEDYGNWRYLDQTFSNDLFLLLSFLIENLNSRPLLSELKLSIVSHTICHNCHNFHNLWQRGIGSDLWIINTGKISKDTKYFILINSNRVTSKEALKALEVINCKF